MDIYDADKETALTLACKHNWPETVETLIEKGANVNHANKWGLTASNYAARYSSSTLILNSLASAGADVAKVPKYYKSYIDLVKQNTCGGKESITNWFKSRGL